MEEAYVLRLFFYRNLTDYRQRSEKMGFRGRTFKMSVDDQK